MNELALSESPIYVRLVYNLFTVHDVSLIEIYATSLDWSMGTTPKLLGGPILRSTQSITHFGHNTISK